MSEVMQVEIALPSRVLGRWDAVSLRADGAHGSFGIRPRHIDYVAVLEPGLIELELPDDTQRFIAVDSGILVKRGADVMVSTRRGLESHDLDELRHTIREVFRQRDEGEVRARAAASKLEMSFVRRLFELENLGG